MKLSATFKKNYKGIRCETVNDVLSHIAHDETLCVFQDARNINCTGLYLAWSWLVEKMEQHKYEEKVGEYQNWWGELYPTFDEEDKLVHLKFVTYWSKYEYDIFVDDLTSKLLLQYEGEYNGFLKQDILPSVFKNIDEVVSIESSLGEFDSMEAYEDARKKND